jgi:dihydroflavonol-4-reductase
MKVLVLGATGQLGANLVRALLAHGDEVRALVRPTSNLIGLRGLDIEQVVGDLSDPESVVRACQGVRVVYQAASYYPRHVMPVREAKAQALLETCNLIQAVRRTGVERLVFTSTLTTIGFPRTPGALADESCPFTTAYQANPYLIAKAAMEQEVLTATLEGIPAVVVNPTVFVGPYDSKPTSGTQILLIARGLLPVYLQGPTNVIDVRDVAVGMIRAAERGRIGERYLLGSWNTTHKDFNKLIARVAGVRAPLLPIPFPLARVGAKLGDWAFRVMFRRPAPLPGFFVEVLQHMQHYDCSKAIRELDYPRTPIEHVIRDALAWFRENGYLPV